MGTGWLKPVFPYEDLKKKKNHLFEKCSDWRIPDWLDEKRTELEFSAVDKD